MWFRLRPDGADNAQDPNALTVDDDRFADHLALRNQV